MTMTGGSPIFVDTNIIVFATDRHATRHQEAIDTLTSLRQQNVELVLSAQILREYLSVTTASLARTGIPALADIIQNFNAFQNDFTVVADVPDVLTNLINLLQTTPSGGR